MEPFNWAQVLRHEYTHTVTLGATDNRIQHWMTEGLAVYEERTPLRWEWVPMLYHAVKKHELFPIDKLTWAFVRPKRPIDRQLAYAESYWICKYIEETYGHETILKMLDDFRNAEPQEDVFPDVTGKPIERVLQRLPCLVRQAGRLAGATTRKRARSTPSSKEEAEKAKDDKDFPKAIDLWEQIVKIRPVDAMPHQRLAGLYIVTKQYDKAIAHLEALHKVELKDNRYAKRIARIYQTQQKWVDAARYALQAVYIYPYDLPAHELLKEVCKSGGDAKGLEREERVIPILTKWLDDQKKAGALRPEAVRPDGSTDKKPE